MIYKCIGGTTFNLIFLDLFVALDTTDHKLVLSPLKGQAGV